MAEFFLHLIDPRFSPMDVNHQLEQRPVSEMWSGELAGESEHTAIFFRHNTVPYISASIPYMIKPGQIIGERLGGDPKDERDHFYHCKECEQMVDMRDLGQVFHHEQKGHSRLPNEVVKYPAKRICRRPVNG